MPPFFKDPERKTDNKLSEDKPEKRDKNFLDTVTYEQTIFSLSVNIANQKYGLNITKSEK